MHFAEGQAPGSDERSENTTVPLVGDSVSVVPNSPAGRVADKHTPEVECSTAPTPDGGDQTEVYREALRWAGRKFATASAPCKDSGGLAVVTMSQRIDHCESGIDLTKVGTLDGRIATFHCSLGAAAESHQRNLSAPDKKGWTAAVRWYWELPRFWHLEQD